jgi:peroxiredoxin Q/BCP
MLTTGSVAPDVPARLQDGTGVHLSDLRGRHVLVYFYPKDDTPGCTAEACSLNDNLEALVAAGADVIGVSTDAWASHARFQARHDLNFALAADGDRTIAAAYGVGRALGFLPVTPRVSFLVGPEGTITNVWTSVNPTKHADQVLDAVRAYHAQSG